MPHVPVEERRTQLVQAAVRVISRDGVAAASTRRIAEEAGASQASVHYSFRSKEELFAAVAEHSVDLTRAAIAERPFGAGIGLRPAVAELLRMFREWAVSDPDLQIAQYELQLWALHTPAHSGLAAQCYETYGRELAAVLDLAATPDGAGHRHRAARAAGHGHDRRCGAADPVLRCRRGARPRPGRAGGRVGRGGGIVDGGEWFE